MKAQPRPREDPYLRFERFWGVFQSAQATGDSGSIANFLNQGNICTTSNGIMHAPRAIILPGIEAVAVASNGQ